MHSVVSGDASGDFSGGGGGEVTAPARGSQMVEPSPRRTRATVRPPAAAAPPAAKRGVKRAAAAAAAVVLEDNGIALAAAAAAGAAAAVVLEEQGTAEAAPEDPEAAAAATAREVLSIQAPEGGGGSGDIGYDAPHEEAEPVPTPDLESVPLAHVMTRHEAAVEEDRSEEAALGLAEPLPDPTFLLPLPSPHSLAAQDDAAAQGDVAAQGEAEDATEAVASAAAQDDLEAEQDDDAALCDFEVVLTDSGDAKEGAGPCTAATQKPLPQGQGRGVQVRSVLY